MKGFLQFASVVLLFWALMACSNKQASPVQMAEASFEIEGMTCSMGCARSIEDKLNETAGILEAKVVFDDKNCIVKYNASEIEKDQIISVVSNMGGGEKYSVNGFTLKHTTGAENVPAGDKTESSGMTKKSLFRPIAFPNVFDAFLRRIK
ncbi:MAG: heavy-metal-associated domain-containing protein [Flavobacteriales bacterium]|nr:heavy-metal-associated domain-containing protein [Flavobacteriales bacterium]